MEQFLQNQKGLVQKVFDKVYDKYDLMNDFMSLGIHRIWKKDFMMMMSPSLNKKLIDVGCGTGNFAHLAAKNSASRVLGIDYAPEAIVIAKNIHKHHNLKFEAINVSQVKEKFDVIVSIGTLEHMDEPFKTLKTFAKR